MKVYALKSTSRIIGAMKLGDFAERLEKAGEAGDSDTLDREIEGLLTKYRELINKLKPIFDIKDDEAKAAKPPVSKEEIKKAYDAISEYCEAFDFDNVVNIVKTFEKFRIPEDETERFEALQEAVDNFDYDKIPEILSGREG